jgi:cyclophilin family peptidyl-prolyl cis-trans isomerase/HEAT repeat protein
VKLGGLARRMPPIVALLSGITACSQDAERSVDPTRFDASDPGLWAAMLEEEDARGSGASGIESLRQGLISLETRLQRAAVRAIGRLEDPELIPLTFPLLFTGDETVRAEAVNALGQAALGTLGDEVADVLFDYLVRERQEGPAVRGAIGRTLGRLRYADADRFRRAQETLSELTRAGSANAPLVTLMGAVMGLESMARGTGRGRMSEASVERLSELAVLGRAADATGSGEGVAGSGDGAPVGTGDVADPLRLGTVALVRRVAMMALSAIGEVGSDVLQGALLDPDPDVRRLAVMAIGRDSEGPPELLIDALTDPFPRVRAEAVRAYAVRAPETQECPLLLNASRDDDLHVALVALDLLEQTCEDRSLQDEFLTGLVAGLENAGPMDWHRGAHALVALAAVSPEVATTFVEGVLRSTNPSVRMYAARAAVLMGSRDVLETLSADSSSNVRRVAVQSLFALDGHDSDSVLVAQLSQNDPHLLLSVAELLEGTTNPSEAVGPLVAALARMSGAKREPARDPRMALLERIFEVGSIEQAADLELYLNDYDPVVAARVAGVLTDWTGEPRVAQPVPPARQPLPAAGEIKRLAGTRVVLEMARGGEIEIRLLVEDAPTNAARFERLAASGYFDGLTFHRVVTNFVLQGGSPGANEYTGGYDYTRDEVGLVSHWRGTVGSSTRGRDTGDGQFFINLVDNLHLDHRYTVFGEVVNGMEVADLVAEGDVIVRATVVLD